jgi:hypothetical protein
MESSRKQNVCAKKEPEFTRVPQGREYLDYGLLKYDAEEKHLPNYIASKTRWQNF